MAKQDVMNAFDKLEKNNNALLGDERRALQALNTQDIMEAKNDLSKKKFDIGAGEGKKITLDQAIKAYESATKSIVFEGKKYPVKLNSDLAAAMQLYLIANGESVSTNRILTADAAKGIDGSIGDSTRGAIDSYKFKASTESVETEKDIVNISDICNKSVVSYIADAGGQISYFENRGIISRTSGKLTPDNLSTFITDKKLVFKYKDPKSGKDVNFSVPITEMNRDHDVNLRKLVENITKQAIKEQKEKVTLSNWETVQKGINDFNENDITDPLVKKWVKMDGVDFWARNYDHTNKKVTVADYKHQDKTSLNKKVSYADLLNQNGSFSSVKFNKFLKEQYGGVALQAVNKYVRDANNSLPQPSSLTWDVKVDARIKDCDSLLNEIDSLNHPIGLAPVRKEVSDKKEAYKNQKDYLQAKAKLKGALDDINFLAGNNNRNFVDKFDQILKEMKKMAVIKKVEGARYTYEVNYATVGRKKFTAVGKKSEYTDMVDKMVNKWKSVQYGGDPMYTISVVGR